MASFLTVNGLIRRIFPSLLFFFFLYLIQGSLERLREKREQIWTVLRKLLNLFLENDQESLQNPRPASNRLSWETGAWPCTQNTVGKGGLRLTLKHSRENVIDADDAVRPRGAAVVNDGSVTLHPDPTAVLRQEPVVLGGHLPLHQH